MSTWRNDFNDPPTQMPDVEHPGEFKFVPSVRVLPHLGWHGVPAGGTVTVPDDQDEHMAAGGWALVEPAKLAAVATPAAATTTIAAQTQGSEAA